jgi:ketopantoate reductase
MTIGILGSGVVGQTIGAKLVERGEDIARHRPAQALVRVALGDRPG